MEFTVVLALDAKHLEQLELVLPTWARFRREMARVPWLCIYDREQVDVRAIQDVLDQAEFPRALVHYTEWPPRGVAYSSQRERMLSAFVHAAPTLVETPYWMKLDSDAFATRSNPDWLPDQWWRDGDAFIGPSWSYSKPGSQPGELDDWGDTVKELKKHPRLDIPYDHGAATCRHKRMASWVSFYDTEWSRWASSLCEYGTLPVPSQDGYHCFVNARTGGTWSPYPAKKLGWANIASTRRLRVAVNEAILAGERPDCSSDQRVSSTASG